MAGRRHHKQSRGLNLLVRAAIGLVVLGVGVGSYQYLVRTKPEPPHVERASLAKNVSTMTAQPVPVVRRWSAYGAARPLNEADVAAEVAARVVSRPEAIDAGASVARGDVLVRLDARPFEAQARRAEQAVAALEAQKAGLDVEARTLEENLRLARQNTRLLYNELELLQEAERAKGATRIEIDRLKRQITAAERTEQEVGQALGLIPTRRQQLEAQIGLEQANLDLARIDIERATIESPIDGIVQEVYVREGERVSPGSPIARITDLSRMEVPLQAPVSAAGSIRGGVRVELRAAGPAQQRWEAQVTRVAPEADPASRTITVFAEIEQDPRRAGPGELLRPGRFVTGMIPVGSPRETIIVPRIAVMEDRVMVVGDQGLARSRAVEVAFALDGSFPTLLGNERQWLAIADGLRAGDEVITSNLDELTEGSPVLSRNGEGAARAQARNGEPDPPERLP